MADEAINIDSWYEAYKKDPNSAFFKDDRLYSKIIFRCEFYRREAYSLMVFIEPIEKLSLEDVLNDEKGNEYIVTGFEMLRFAHVPEWYPRISPMIITGNTYDIGNYLSKKPNSK